MIFIHSVCFQCSSLVIPASNHYLQVIVGMSWGVDFLFFFSTKIENAGLVGM